VDSQVAEVIASITDGNSGFFVSGLLWIKERGIQKLIHQGDEI